MGMWSKATLRILPLKQERERACCKGQSLSYSIEFCCFDLSMTTSQWEIYYPQSNLFYGKGKNPSTEWKRLTAKQGYLFHEFPNLRKLFVGWTTHFNLVLKMGRLQMKTTLYIPICCSATSATLWTTKKVAATQPQENWRDVALETRAALSVEVEDN